MRLDAPLRSSYRCASSGHCHRPDRIEGVSPAENRRHCSCPRPRTTFTDGMPVVPGERRTGQCVAGSSQTIEEAIVEARHNPVTVRSCLR